MTQDELLKLIDQAAAEGWTELDLSGQGLTELPPEIGKLTQLETLILGKWELKNGYQYFGNKLTSLPDEIGQLCALKVLIVMGDLILQRRKDGNQITAIPDSLAQLSSLQQLDLRSNQITAISDSLAQLSSLQQLNLGNNQITAIPDSLAQLSSLQQLDLRANQITAIPDSLAQLSSLQQLDLRANQITAIPDSLENLTNLVTLDLRLNLLPISPEIIDPPRLYGNREAVEEIFNYVRQLRSGEKKPLNEAKMLLIGQGSVGKTSLIKQLMEGTFNPHEAQTDGLSVRTWGVHVNSKDVRLNVWDFGGQEIYHATHQFFLTKRSLYILVCNCRTSEEENHIEYWLKLIKSFGGESPVIIVGNKSDEQPLDINRKALREKYPNICAILETSCQTGQGIEALRAKITEEVGKLREVYNLLPLSWFQVKEQLEALDKDFISYGEYIGICYQNQILEEQNQTQLIELLHNLGLVLNFRSHPFLQNTNVLNPDWVTAAIPFCKTPTSSTPTG